MNFQERATATIEKAKTNWLFKDLDFSQKTKNVLANMVSLSGEQKREMGLGGEAGNIIRDIVFETDFKFDATTEEGRASHLGFIDGVLDGSVDPKDHPRK